MGRRQEPDVMSEIVLHKANLLLELSTFNLKLLTGRMPRQDSGVRGDVLRNVHILPEFATLNFRLLTFNQPRLYL